MNVHSLVASATRGLQAARRRSSWSRQIRALRGAGVLGALVLLGACATEEPGISPERDKFYFPTGAVLDPLGRNLLFVSNSNADLLYNGGTLMVVDLRQVPTDLNEVAKRVQAGTLSCQADATDPTVWACPETKLVQPDATIRIGSYPSDVRVNSRGDRLFVPLRGQSALLWAEIVDLGDNRVDIRCNSASDSGCGATGKANCSVWDCDDAHQVTYSDGLRKVMPAEPYGIYLNETVAVHVDSAGVRRTCRDGVSSVSCTCDAGQPGCVDATSRGCCSDSPGLDHIYLTHLSGGEISFLTATPSLVVLRDIRAGWFAQVSGISGALALAARTPGDPETMVVAGSRVDATLASFAIRQNARIIDTARIPVAAIAPAADVRGIAFAPGGDRLYVVDRQPASLVAIDMTVQENGLPKGEPLWAAEVCNEPSNVVLGQDPTRPDDPTALLAYVVCFGAAQIFVVDTTLGRVVDQILTGKGPSSLQLDPANRRAFITNFLDNTIGIVDLDPSHARFHRMVLRIGTVKNLVR